MSESILDRIQADMTAAMKSRDATTLATLRMLKAAIMEARTRKPKNETVTRDEEIEILQRYAKKRRETIEELRKVKREDLIASEEREIEITARYLPQAMAEEDLRAIIRETAAKVGASSPQEMGKLIGAVMAQVKGRADGGTVSRLVKETLAG